MTERLTRPFISLSILLTLAICQAGAKDPNEWNNLASDEKFAELKTEMQRSAPTTFAQPEEKLNVRKDLVIEGESFRWEKGKGNAQPKPAYRPTTKKSTIQ